MLGNNVNVTKFVTDEIFALDIYSKKSKDRWISLEIKTVGDKAPCRTKAFYTGSYGHVRIEEDGLGHCDRFMIQDGIANLTLINKEQGSTIIGKVHGEGEGWGR